MRYLIAITFCLCLIAAIVPPVLGYTLVSEYQMTSVGTNTNPYGLVGGGAGPHNYLSNVTRIVFDGNISRWRNTSTPETGSAILYGYSGANYVGRIQLTWDVPQITFVGNESGQFTFDILDAKQNYAGADLYLENSTGVSQRIDNVLKFDVIRGSWNTVDYMFSTTSASGYNGAGFYKVYTGSPEIIADFYGVPTNGSAPLYVAFQDTSSGIGLGVVSYNWSVTPDAGVIGEESMSEYPTLAFTLSGNYTITHCVAYGSLSDCEEKTNYIWVYNDSSLATTTFWAVDPLGHRVWDSAINLQDVENSSWTNKSSPSGGVATITSLFSHTINGYATAAGYNDGETLGIPADGVSGGIILMTPTNITNVSAGYVTLYAYVKDSTSNAPISGAYVNIAYAEGGSTRNDGGTTSTEGVSSFVVPNNTLIYVYGEKAGYERVSTTKDSGSASGGSASVSVILYMGSQTITPTVTATTGPGGTVPVTVDPRTPAEKEADIANILIDYGDMLVMFFIALTVIGGVKMIMR